MAASWPYLFNRDVNLLDFWSSVNRIKILGELIVSTDQNEIYMMADMVY